MAKGLNSAIRRHHLARLKKNRKDYWGFYRAYPRGEASMSEAQLGKVVQYPQPCSCAMCGNPRQHSWFKKERLTLKERMFMEVEDDWMNDLAGLGDSTWDQLQPKDFNRAKEQLLEYVGRPVPWAGVLVGRTPLDRYTDEELIQELALRGYYISTDARNL